MLVSSCEGSTESCIYGSCNEKLILQFTLNWLGTIYKNPSNFLMLSTLQETTPHVSLPSSLCVQAVVCRPGQEVGLNLVVGEEGIPGKGQLASRTLFDPW